MAQFSLVDNEPKPHTFRDTDGLVYEVPTARMFGTRQFAELERLQAGFLEVRDELRSADEATMLPAAKRLDQVVNTFFQMLVPRMPPDRVYELAIVDKVAFIQWWQLQEAKTSTRGEARAGKKTSRGRPLPASSTRTKSTRNGS